MPPSKERMNVVALVAEASRLWSRRGNRARGGVGPRGLSPSCADRASRRLRLCGRARKARAAPRISRPRHRPHRHARHHRSGWRTASALRMSVFEPPRCRSPVRQRRTQDQHDGAGLAERVDALRPGGSRSTRSGSSSWRSQRSSVLRETPTERAATSTGTPEPRRTARSSARSSVSFVGLAIGAVLSKARNATSSFAMTYCCPAVEAAARSYPSPRAASGSGADPAQTAIRAPSPSRRQSRASR